MFQQRLIVSTVGISIFLNILGGQRQEPAIKTSDQCKAVER